MLESMIIITATGLALLALGGVITVAMILLLDGPAVFTRKPHDDQSTRQHP